MIWLLSFFPNFVFHLIVIIAILGLLASFFFGFMPFVGKYTIPIKIISIILLIIGVWFEGGISNNDAWLTKVKDLEFQVAKAEAKSNEANTTLTSQIANKNKEIAKVQSELKNRVKEMANVMDAECKIPAFAINILNDAARGPKGGKK
jgi:hypothetical protein